MVVAPGANVDGLGVADDLKVRFEFTAIVAAEEFQFQVLIGGTEYANLDCIGARERWNQAHLIGEGLTGSKILTGEVLGERGGAGRIEDHDLYNAIRQGIGGVLHAGGMVVETPWVTGLGFAVAEEVKVGGTRGVAASYRGVRAGAGRVGASYNVVVSGPVGEAGIRVTGRGTAHGCDRGERTAASRCPRFTV